MTGVINRVLNSRLPINTWRFLDKQYGALGRGQQGTIVMDLMDGTTFSDLFTKAFGGTSAVYQSQRLQVTRARFRGLFVNSSNSNMLVTAYHIGCRTDNATQTPVTAWQNGYLDMGGVATDYLYVGSKPTDSPQFNRHFRVLKQRRFTMRPGANKWFYMRRKKPFITEYNDWDGFANRKGITQYMMIVFHGSLENDETASSAETTTTTVSCCYMPEEEVKYRIVTTSAATFDHNGNLPTTTPAPQNVNTLTGLIQVPDIV